MPVVARRFSVDLKASTIKTRTQTHRERLYLVLVALPSMTVVHSPLSGAISNLKV